VCLPCASSLCLRCAGSSTCVECKKGAVMEENSLCIEAPRMQQQSKLATRFMDEITCYSVLCTACTGTESNECTVCVENAQKNNNKSCSCKNGFYQDSNQCLPCSGHLCRRCSREGGSRCNSCFGNATRNEEKTECACNEGYKDTGTSCVMCDASCADYMAPGIDGCIEGECADGHKWNGT
jgi:hypothetical protein